MAEDYEAWIPDRPPFVDEDDIEIVESFTGQRMSDEEVAVLGLVNWFNGYGCHAR